MADETKRADEDSYGKILKHTSVFGGVQIFRILINLIRGKFVAMFLGPAGMGVSAMFNSASDTVSRFSSLGLNLAFVKESAAVRDNAEQLGTIRYISTLLLRFTALLGLAACVIFSPVLSRISFGNTDYAWQFALLGIAVAFAIAGDAKMAMLQGLHKVKIISRTSIAGALSGLLVGVPLYYFFGTKGIVPAMIVLALTTYGFYSYGIHKSAPKAAIRFDKALHKPIIKRMFATGLILLSSNLIYTCCNYCINIFMRVHGDLSDVGLFNAANSITLQYTGIVFTAMAMDYFPRLSAAANDNPRMITIVNRQLEIVALIAAPLSLLLVITAPIIIRLLLTVKFLPITPLMRWLGISILIKALAYPLGYIAFAKDNRRLFFWMEAVVCNVLYVALSIVFYNFFGLMGLGYAAVIEQTACVFLYLGVNFKVYGLRLNSATLRETLIAVLFGAIGFILSITLDGVIGYTAMGIVAAICAYRSFRVLKALVKSKS